MRKLCETRSNTYYCFSLCFDYPTPTLFEPATVKLVAETINSLPQLCGLETLNSAANFFTEEFSRSGDSSGVPLLYLQIEYNRLFAGPSKPQAYPCEEAFLNQSGWAVSSVPDLVREYKDGGLRMAPGFKDSPDHISLEFEFMSHLCQEELIEEEMRGSRGSNDRRERQRSFLEKHIVNWVPAFLATVERSAVLGFYKSLARITRAFVICDYAYVEDRATARKE